MMERLTERTENGGIQYEDRNGYYHTFYGNGAGDPVHALAKKLCDLEDKIEQGTLIELPCKVGDTVYGFSCCRQFGGLSGKIFKGRVIAFYIERGLYLRIEAEHDNGNFYLEYDKEVFLTREEAEKRLKEIQQ